MKLTHVKLKASLSQKLRRNAELVFGQRQLLLRVE